MNFMTNYSTFPLMRKLGNSCPKFIQPSREGGKSPVSSDFYPDLGAHDGKSSAIGIPCGNGRHKRAACATISPANDER